MGFNRIGAWCAMTLVAATLAGCHRSRALVPDNSPFRIVTRNGASALLSPPVVDSYDQTPLSFSTPLPGVKAAKLRGRQCRIANDLFDLAIAGGRNSQVTLRMPPAQKWEGLLATWDQLDNRTVEASLDELLAGPEVLEQRRCLPTASALQVRQFLRETIPMRPMDGLYSAYGHRPGSGALDLRSGLRLSIQRAHFSLPPERRKSTIDGYAGITTARYDCVQGAKGRLTFRFAGADYSTDALKQSLASGFKDLEFAKDAAPRLVYRSFFLTHYVRAGIRRSAIIAGASTIEEMRTVERKLRDNPGTSCDSLTGGTANVCIAFEGDVTVSTEVQIIVNGETRYLPWGITVRMALAQARAPQDALKSLELWRLWKGQLRPLEIEGDRSALLNVMLVGGDKIAWTR
jgi:hypothetical protein